MATLAELADGVYRDLADEAKQVFSILQIEDFIRGGISELNRVAPLDMTEGIALVTDIDTGVVTQWSYPTVIHLPYLVEYYRHTDGYAYVIGEGEPGQTGSHSYLFRATPTGGVIDFPQWWLMGFPASTHSIRVHGYGSRPLPESVVDPEPSPETGLGSDEEYSVRAYAKSAGYDLLAHDRSLFAQWQGQTNNTDVSPTQVTQMAAGAKQEWDRHRGLIRVVRRYW